MTKRPLVAVAAVVALPAAPAEAHDGCNTAPCEKRVAKRFAHEKWRKAVHRYGVGLLRARMLCESGHHGGWSLSTTGNGYWFGLQFDVGAWTGAGGRVRLGRPVGVWSTQPEPLEQKFRAVVWDYRHGGDPWPNCP